MPQPRILVSPSSFGECGRAPLDLLRRAGYAYRLNPSGRKLTAAEVLRLGKNCVGIVAGVEPLNAAVLENLPGLRCISRCGTGLDNVDLEKARQLGIAVRRTPEGPTRAVAELAVGLMFCLARRIPAADKNLRRGRWRKETGTLLLGKTAGIVGLGRIGKTTAVLCQALGLGVLAHDPKPDEAWAGARQIRCLEFDDLLKTSDFVFLHASFDGAARPLLGRRELALMKKESCLVNLSRGGAVDEKALFQALKSRRIAGAALDVFACEPYRGPLTKLDNAVLTPHIGSYAREAKLRMELDAVKNLIEALGS